MQLSVPHRTVADTGSFPVNPEGVSQWLDELRPLESEADAREIYRGLKHSNRLHNDIARRRSVISCFIPVLRQMHQHLTELSNAQPLPLTREFARGARLRDALLREEAFAFKILLADSDTPLADDARRAMQALARQAEAVVHGYRAFPAALIEDAHQLYALAEKHDLLSEEPDSELLSLQDHYRYILLLSSADLSQQRTRQLPLVMEFLKNCVSDIHIQRERTADTIGYTDYAINLALGSRPEPALSLLSAQQSDIRWFSVAPVLFRIHRESPDSNASSGSVLGSEILERQSLARLHVALARTRKRRLARCTTMQPHYVVFGHKQVCADLLYRSADNHANHESGWAITNRTLNGVCLSNNACRAGVVQVGELVSVTDPDTALMIQDRSLSSRADTALGMVRWVRANGDQGITVGVEFLARTVLPVHVTRDTHEPEPDPNDADNEANIGEPAIIIACKVNNKVLQTLLLPAYLYHTDDRLVARQGARSRRVQLKECLQRNGLFSQYSLADTQAFTG